jgi:hypothetical protein
MNINKIVIALLTLATSQLLVAAGPIDFNNATLVKRLKKSVENPIDLYKSTDAQHLNKLFTVRMIGRLEQGGLPSYEQTALRNEICASQKIQTANVGNAIAATPGSIGIYKLNESVVAVQDEGLMGEKLDAVLRKLSTASVVEKINIAANYALDMKRLLDAIHAADITWNNASLGNFYVRPDGSLTAVDFSAAKNSPGGVDTQDKKNERTSFLANTVRHMYDILFPAIGEANADNAYAQFIALPGVGAAWRTDDLTAVRFNGVAAGAVLPPDAYIPGRDSELAALNGILRGEHDATGLAANHGANGFVLHPDVVPLVAAAPGAPAWANLTVMCAGW